jgi:hypothetical protein
LESPFFKGFQEVKVNGEGVNYEALLADLEAKKARIEALIAGIREFMGASPSSGLEAAPPVPNASPVVKQEKPSAAIATAPDTFFRMTLPDAIKKYLNTVKRKQSVPQITVGLEAGGFPHRSRDFRGTVRTTLKRGEPHIFQRFSRGEWGLTEWRSRTQRDEASEGEE